MKNGEDGLGVQNIFDLVLKKCMVFIKQKTLQSSKLKNTK